MVKMCFYRGSSHWARLCGLWDMYIFLNDSTIAVIILKSEVFQFLLHVARQVCTRACAAPNVLMNQRLCVS